MTVSHGNDLIFMAAAIRLARMNLGLTGLNPSVATLIVKDGVIVGRGVTAMGGRPHAETQAIADAGDKAHGATAYVTLEPCAHHGGTPPCAEALVRAGIARVVIATLDPDPRVSGKGVHILRGAGLSVIEGVLASEAHDSLSGYMYRTLKKRPQVTLKLAISSDGMIGKMGKGQVAITGEATKRMVHIMRAQSDAIMIGSHTALVDDPQLTCRLHGLENRSPIRIVLDSKLSLPLDSQLARTATHVPVWLAALITADENKRQSLQGLGCQILNCTGHNGKIALPELMDDLGAQGLSNILLEGGASAAAALLERGLVNRVVLFVSQMIIGQGGIASPLNPAHMPPEFKLVGTSVYGTDTAYEYEKV